MEEIIGSIYILTNKSFPEYVKIGYADNPESVLKKLNKSKSSPFPFEMYAKYDVEERFTDDTIQKIVDEMLGKPFTIDREYEDFELRGFMKISAEQASAIFQAVGIFSHTLDRFKQIHEYEPVIGNIHFD